MKKRETDQVIKFEEGYQQNNDDDWLASEDLSIISQKLTTDIECFCTHNSDVTWMSWRLKSQKKWLFIEPPVQAVIDANI